MGRKKPCGPAPDWLKRPSHALRIARESLAASHVRHPNLTSLEDLHEAGGTIVFVGELVPGRKLTEAAAARKRLEPRAAVVAVLQAARGLKYAHDRGFRHRHIGADALILDREGVVTLQGLGLWADPDRVEELDRLEAEFHTPKAKAEVRGTGSATGSEPLISAVPDPGEEARLADIADLGRTLSALIGGSRSAGRDETQPRESLGAIIGRMTGEGPGARFRNLGEVIPVLESFLGIDGSRPLVLPLEQSEVIERSVALFRNPPSGQRRRQVLLGTGAVLLALTFVSLIAGGLILALGFLGFGAVLAVVYLLWAHSRRRTPMFDAFRALAVSSLLADPLSWLVGVVLAVVALWALGLIGVAVTFVVAAGLLVFVFRRWVDRRFDEERQGALELVHALLKDLRLEGHGEDVLRRFVWVHGGIHSEAFYEGLFGTDALQDAQTRWGQEARSRRWLNHFAWRATIIAWLDGLRETRRERRLRHLFRGLVERGECAKGVNQMTARRRSWRAAEAILTTDAELRAMPRTTTPPPDLVRLFREAALHPDMVLVDREVGLIPDRERSRALAVLDVLLGPRLRLLAGGVLTAGCLLWMHQNGLIPGREVRDLAEQALTIRDLDQARELGAAAGKLPVRVLDATRPLDLPPLPRRLTVPLSGFGAGVGGLILLVSSAFRGWRLSLFVVPAAAIAIVGPKVGVPGLGGLGPEAISTILAGALAGMGFLFGRTR